MSAEWNFPSNNYGTLSGIGEAGIETFKGAPYRSLAREICQNSLDAGLNNGKPVRVVFSLSSIPASSIPKFFELKDAITRCLSFWTEQNNVKTIAFFKEADKLAEQPSIDLLRISDFNTTGLTGSDQEYSTPWQNLVKASGVSSKGGSAGGSFGIGKSAPFACSKLRTVFYATRDKNRLEAFQGIARLVSFRMKGIFHDQDSVTTGIGYYGEKKKNAAIKKCISLDLNYERKESGTDVFVLGFMKSSTWKREMIKAVLEDFLIAVYKGSLEVQVDDILITGGTLPEVIEDFKEEAPSAWNYYQVLTSPATEIIRQSFNGLGEIELRILIQNDLHRRVLMTRINGMKIFDQKNISSSIQFAGICVLSDEGINSYFREMENPQHDAWEPERHSKPTAAKKSKTELARFIKETILDRGRKTTVDEMDAEGVGEFLPDETMTEGNPEARNETPMDTTKDIEITVSKPKNWQKGFEHSLPTSGEGEEDNQGEQTGMDFGDEGGKDDADDGSNTSAEGDQFGNGDGNGPGTHGDGDHPFPSGDGKNPDGEAVTRKTSQVQLMAVRIYRNGAANSYCLIFTPKKSYESGYVQLKLSGEQKSVKVDISGATIGGQRLPVSENRIFLKSIEAGHKASIDFTVAYSESCAMEVSLYGYSL